MSLFGSPRFPANIELFSSKKTQHPQHVRPAFDGFSGMVPHVEMHTRLHSLLFVPWMRDICSKAGWCNLNRDHTLFDLDAGCTWLWLKQLCTKLVRSGNWGSDDPGHVFHGRSHPVCVEKVVFRDYPPRNEAGIPTQAMFESMILLFPFGGIC